MKTYPKFIHKSSMTESSIFGYDVQKWFNAQLALQGITTWDVCCADGETKLTVDQRFTALETEDESNAEDIAALRTQEGTYTEYRVLVSQIGVAIPTAVVLNNTLGGTPVFAYVSPGVYTLTNTGKFLVNKTEPILTPSVADTTTFAIRTSADVITFGVNVASTGVATDAKLTTSSFVVKVYA